MKNLLRLLMIIALLTSLAGGVAACSEEADCSGTARPMLQCYLYTVNPEDGNVDKDTLETLTVTALVNDTVIINNQQKVQDLSLPLRYTADSTALVFHYPEGLSDTVVFFHENTPYFLSMDCGYQMKQALTGVQYTRHLLDSIYVRNKEAGIYGTENIKLFY